MRSLRGRIKAVGTYLAERREADRFQPEGWETAEGRAILSQYRAEMNGKPVNGGLAHGEPVNLEVAHCTPHTLDPRPRHASDDVAVNTGHRPRHDGTQSQVGSSYLLTRPPTTRHGVPDEPVPAGAETARVLTITNVIHGPDGDPLAGAIVTISLIADHVPGFPQSATIDGVARIVPAGAAEITRASLTGRALVRTPVSRCEESE
jgi:hypothetical protein